MTVSQSSHQRSCIENYTNSPASISSPAGLILRVSLVAASLLSGYLCYYFQLLPTGATAAILLIPLPLFFIDIVLKSCCVSSEKKPKISDEKKPEILDARAKFYPNNLFRALTEGKESDIEQALQDPNINLTELHHDQTAPHYALFCNNAAKKFTLLIESKKFALDDITNHHKSALYCIFLPHINVSDDERIQLFQFVLSKGVEIKSLEDSALIYLARIQRQQKEKTYLPRLEKEIKKRIYDFTKMKNLIKDMYFSYKDDKEDFISYILSLFKEKPEFHRAAVEIISSKFNEALSKLIDYEMAEPKSVAKLLTSCAFTKEKDLCAPILARIKSTEKLKAILDYLDDEVDEIKPLKEEIQKRVPL